MPLSMKGQRFLKEEIKYGGLRRTDKRGHGA